MRTNPLFVLLALSSAIAGCPTNSAPDAGTWHYQRPTVPPGALLIETPEFQIAPSTESLMCTYSEATTTDAIVTREIHSYQAPGGHHAAIFYTESPQTPGTHPCTDAEMSNWRFIGGGQESMESALNLPTGVAIRIPAGRQIVVQSHYVNVDPVVRTVRDALVIVPADPSTIQNIADAFNIFDPDLSIPPGAMYRRTLDCPIESDMTFATALGHTHHWGTRAWIEFTHNGTSRTIYDEVGGDRLQFSPPVHFYTGADAIVAHPGDHLRLSCEWNNTTTGTLTVPAEMCAALLYYYPGQGSLVCQNVVDTWSSVPIPDGGTDAGSTNGNAGCTTAWTPDQPCVRTCNTGNEIGVGRYCTAGGNQCSRLQAFICTADVDPSGPTFCTRPCTSNANCGSGAVCTGDARGMGCVPVECVGPSDGGGDAAIDATADGSAAMDASGG